MAASSRPRSAPKAGGKLERAMPGLKERAKTLVELLDNAEYLFAKRPDRARCASEQGCSTRLGAKTLGALLPRLESVETWTPEALEAAVRALCRGGRAEARQGGAAAARGPDRADHLAGIFDVLEVLGREESLARIRDQVLQANLLNLCA